MSNDQPTKQQIFDVVMDIRRLLDGTAPPSKPEQIDDQLLHSLAITNAIEATLDNPQFAPEGVLHHCRLLRASITKTRALLWEQTNNGGAP